ncbi:G2/mitotic-specific cyclin-B3 [Apodemus sylvaticus]|uniref:G2/mitotic-specific cyclin-B3 n=1 Tax=Apodemus sylvaticus TaxID=10129 RepID=UPI002244B86C|nr:G2/mitotic-specific cyclin-B3 [Apodemus sylvaticus]
MPPLLNKRSKAENEKAESDEITTMEDQQSEKIKKSNHSESSSSSQSTVKKRSAFEDVTNASHDQCVQSKEDNMELRSHVSKRTNKGAGEVTQKRRKRSKMGRGTSVSNMEKEFVLDIPNKPNTLTTEEPAIFQKTLVLNDESDSGETCFMKRTLKSCAFHQETLLIEPLTLLEETEDFNEFDSEELMTSEEKEEPEEVTRQTLRPLEVQPVTHKNGSLSSQKSTTKKKDSHFHGPSVLPDKHIPQMEASTVKKSLALQNPTSEEMLHFPEATVLKKQHNMEEVPYLKKSSPLRKQQQLPKRRGFSSNSAVKETVTSEQLSFKKSTTEKDPPFQGSFTLRKKHNSPESLSRTLKKRFVTPKPLIDEDSYFQLDSASKKQHVSEEPGSSNKPIKLEMQQTITKETGFHLKNPPTVTSGAKSLTKEPPPFGEENTPLLKSKCTSHTITLQQAQTEWQETIDEDRSLFSIKCGSYREEPTPGFLQSPLPPNENCLISQKLSLSMSFASQTITSQERAHSKESVASSDEENFSQDLFSPFSSDEDTLKFHKSLDIQEKVDSNNYSPPKMFVSQDSVSEEESFLRKLFCKDRHSSSEESSQERTVALEQEFLLKKLLNEDTRSDVDGPLSHQSPHIQNHSGTMEEAMEASETSEEPLNIQEEISTENIVALMKSLITEDESIKETFIRNYTIAMEAHAEKSLSLEESSVNEVATLKEPLSSQEKHRAVLVTVLKELLVLVKNPRLERVVLAFQENPPSNVETLLREVLALVENTTADESTLKEPLALQENPSIKKSSPKDSLSFDHKPNAEKSEITRTSLTVEELNMDTLYERALARSHGLIAADQLAFTNLQNFEESKIVDEEEFFKSFLVFENENSPNMFSNAFKDRKDNSSDVMSSLEKLSPVMNSNPHVSSSSFQSTLGGKETEIIILDDSDTLESIESEDYSPPLNSSYTKDIFIYLKEREEMFIVEKYMHRQMELTSDMRAILVDWLVEIQTSFQLSHETLYLAVKLMDLYLMKVQCEKNHLQLLGSTAYMIAAKFEESYPPSLSEFLYTCEEDLYQKNDMLSLERHMLKTLNFEINIPTAYNFLRRYASCIHVSMKTLTLSRYICEMTLQEYEYIEERPSKLAAASFVLALFMRNLNDCVPTLEYSTGYQMAELHIVVRKLNYLLNHRSETVLKNVYEKYCEETYFEVAKIPLLSKKELEDLLNYALFS